MNRYILVFILSFPLIVFGQKTKTKVIPKKQVVTKSKQPEVRYERFDGDSTKAYELFKKAFYAVDPQEKINLYTQSLEAAPNFLDAYLNRAATRVELGNYQDAIDELEKIKVATTRQYDIFYNCGLAYYRDKQYKKAKNDFEKAKTFKPDSKDVENALVAVQNQLDAGCAKYKTIELSRKIKIRDITSFFDCMQNVKINDNSLMQDLTRLKGMVNLELGKDIRRLPDMSNNRLLKSINIASDSLDYINFLGFLHTSKLEQFTFVYNPLNFKQPFLDNINSDTLNIVLNNADDFIALSKIDAPNMKAKIVRIISNTPVPNVNSAILFNKVVELNLFINEAELAEIRKLLPNTKVAYTM
jgi:uncharacterized protein YkvS